MRLVFVLAAMVMAVCDHTALAFFALFVAAMADD